MALAQCSDCSNAVSTDAEACPACGKLLRRGWPPILYLAVGALVLAVVNIITATMAGRGGARFVASKDLLTSCVAVDAEARCSFTNATDATVATCVQSKVAQKKASGVAISSHPICSGPLAPFETKNISAHWIGGFARDICNRKIGDTEVLDWDQCEFTTSAYERR